MAKLECKIRFEKEEINKYGDKVKKYNYLTDINDLKAGDMVVVHARDGFEIAYFVEYCIGTTSKGTKWITDKVNTEAHYKRMENEKRAKAIKERLEIERKKTEELQIYEILAQKNPEIKSLLNELKSLLED